VLYQIPTKVKLARQLFVATKLNKKD